MRIPVHSQDYSYEIVLAKNCLLNVADEINLDRKILLVSDQGVPPKYLNTVAEKCSEPVCAIVPQGEKSKCLEQYAYLLSLLIDNKFTRSDAVIAIGGGVVGDLAGFVAASYMRGINFYNIPTTLLAQLDSSIGGKTAINLGHIKNVVGAFYQPAKVLIDPQVLESLPERQKNAGLAEAIKMAATSNAKLFSYCMNNNAFDDIEMVIRESLLIKARVVEKDVYENNLRRVLNFGHTVGHAIEVNSELLHGECVAIGMLYFCSEKVREELRLILAKYNLPTSTEVPVEKLYEAILHDKKASGNVINIVQVNEIGKFDIKALTFADFYEFLRTRHSLVNHPK